MIAVVGFVARNHVFSWPAAIIRQEPPPWIKPGAHPVRCDLPIIAEPNVPRGDIAHISTYLGIDIVRLR